MVSSGGLEPASLRPLAPGSSRRPLGRSALVLADVVAVVLAGASLALARPDVAAAGWAVVAAAPVWVLLAAMNGLYGRRNRSLRGLTLDDAPAISAWAVSGTAVVAFALAAAGTPVDVTAGVWIAVVAGATALGSRASVRALWRPATPPERVLLVGDSALAASAGRKLEQLREAHARAVGHLLRAEDADASALDGVDRVLVAVRGSVDDPALLELAERCRAQAVALTVVLPPDTLFARCESLERVGELPMLFCAAGGPTRATLVLKRTLDVAVSFTCLVVLAPVLALVAVAIKLDTRGPIIFRQVRAGVGGRPFTMLKFRTMAEDAPARLPELVVLDKLPSPVFKLRDDPRVTRVGRLLRRTSLDEVPQLFNVVRGDMSLVGPRPEEMSIVERYLPEHRFRLSVRPGVTGPMQVYGRATLTFEERLALERDYIENVSLRRDLRLLALTPGAVIRGIGAF